MNGAVPSKCHKYVKIRFQNSALTSNNTMIMKVKCGKILLN